MKRIIGGKVYSTETAKELIVHDTETLFQKRTGEFFLYENGYRDQGERIIPLSYDEAKKWTKENADSDDYIKIFEPDDDNNKSNLNLYIRNDLITKIKTVSAKSGKSISDIVSTMIENC